MRLEKPAHLRDQKVVVIVGGGFAGLNAARRLANVPGVRVLLIDKRNHHLFQPLLYQVATAGLNAADIAVPIRRQFRHASNVEIHLGKVERVDLRQRIVVGGGHERVVLIEAGTRVLPSFDAKLSGVAERDPLRSPGTSAQTVFVS